jgi:hypothetical protein
MRQLLVALTLVAHAMCFAASAGAQQPMAPAAERQADPGAAGMAAVANIVYAPVRFAVTLVNAAFGGLTGFMTLNDVRAADDVFDITTGPGFLQPEMIRGQRSVEVGEMRYGTDQ